MKYKNIKIKIDKENYQTLKKEALVKKISLSEVIAERLMQSK